MISFIKGTLLSKNEKTVNILAGSVGYKIAVTPDTLFHIDKITNINADFKIENNGNKSPNEPEISLWIYTSVRENAIDLFGFLNEKELEMFELLITISGIGPKTALGVLSNATVETLEEAISTGETGTLTKVSGISKKNAEKIVLELKGKCLSAKNSTKNIGANPTGDIDVVEALKSLGYSPAEARDVLKEIPKSAKTVNEKIKSALKLLSK